MSSESQISQTLAELSEEVKPQKVEVVKPAAPLRLLTLAVLLNLAVTSGFSVLLLNSIKSKEAPTSNKVVLQEVVKIESAILNLTSEISKRLERIEQELSDVNSDKQALMRELDFLKSSLKSLSTDIGGVKSDSTLSYSQIMGKFKTIESSIASLSKQINDMPSVQALPADDGSVGGLKYKFSRGG